MRLIFDIETDGFYEVVSKIHCIVVKDRDTGTVHTFRPHEIEQGLKLLAEASQLIAHNGIGYDIPVIQKLYPEWTHRAEVLDTLVISRVGWPEIKHRDIGKAAKGEFPGKLIGSHSLEAWGHRLGLLKGDYGQQEDAWAVFTEEMLDYCVQDVAVTERLLEAIERKGVSPTAVQLEHDVAWILATQMRTGFPFDERKGQELYLKLAAERDRVRRQLETLVRPWYAPEYVKGRVKTMTPKANNTRYGYTAGATFSYVKLNTFNPGSDQQIADRLKTLYGWEPTEFTPTGQPKVDEDTLSQLPYPIAKVLTEYQMLNKRIGQVAEGEQGWLKVVKAGRIYGYINQNGAVTGRATHSRPNIGQVPANGIPYGRDCRELFHVPEVWDGREWEMLGTDMSGLELRCLGHFMARWDKGAYIQEILSGDVHTANQQAAGLPTRDNAKTFIYGFLYGAGAAKIGSIVGKGPKVGRALINRFLSRTPALAKLREAVQKAAERGYIIGLDGRHVPIRSSHSALNTLLQGAGALLCKRWMVEFHTLCRDAGYLLERDYYQLAWVHDELQLMIPKGTADVFGQFSVLAAQRAGEYFNFRCPLTAEFKSGRNWAETH